MKFASVNPALSKTITNVLDETCKRQISFSKRIPVNMQDPTRKRFGYSQRAAIIGPDRICQIPLPVFFSDLFFQPGNGMGHTMEKNDPDPIWMAWPGVWLLSCCLKASWCADITGPGFWQEPTGPLLVSHFQIQLHSSTDVLDNIIQNQPGANLVLVYCARFWPNGSGPEVSQCARIIRPASGQCFQPDPARMRIGSGICLLG